MGTLFIVATPIGNLKDITLRALETLREADLILCEDTRVTRKLLSHYTIPTATLSYHQHSSERRVKEIIGLLRGGRNIALVSDAGTPGISDPGNELVDTIVRELADAVRIVPIPGPCALIVAASASGFPMNKFMFLGYPPAKKKRKRFFEEIADSKYPAVFYESPHRITKTLREIAPFIGEKRKVMVCRELTKKFESMYRGTILEALNRVEADIKKGEYTIVVDGIRGGE